MKNLIALSLFLFFISSSCSSDHTQKISSSQDLQIGQNDNFHERDKVMFESGYDQMRVQEEIMAWQEVDLLYRNTIEGKESSISLTNFKKSVIKDLVFRYDIINVETTDKHELFEFYANEIYNTDNLSLPSCNYLLLSNLSNHWSNQKIVTYANDAIEKGKGQRLKKEKVIRTLSTKEDDLVKFVVKDLKKSLETHDEAIVKLKVLAEVSEG